MKRLLFLLGFSGLFQIPFACNPCPGPNYPNAYVIADIAVELGTQGVSAGLPSTHADSSLVNIVAAGFNEPETMAWRTSPTNGWGWAYACSPAPVPIVNRPVALLITATDTLYLGGEELLPGSTLNAFFRENIYDYEQVDSAVAHLADFEEFTEEEAYPFLSLQLNVAPDEAFETVLSVQLTLEDGTELAAQSQTWTLDSW